VNRRQLIGFALTILGLTSLVLSACAPPTPEEVVVTVEVEKIVEKEVKVVETVEVEKIVEKEMEIVVTATPVPPECTPAIEPPLIMYPGKIVMCTNPTVPPLQYVKEDGSLAGLRIELGEEIARRLCLEPHWVNIQFSAMIPGLTGGRFDMINTGIWFKEERAEIMEMVPYELSGHALAVRMDDPVDIQSIEDLAGLTVAVEAAGVAESAFTGFSEDLVAKGLEAIDVRSFNTVALGFAALEAGQVDAAVGADAQVISHDQKGEFRMVLSGLSASPSTLACANTELAETIASLLQEMYEDGFYDELFDKYRVRKIMDWSDWTDPAGDPNNVYGWDGEFKVY
jgi:polar amino acid transport system substrate-binding protein